MKQRIDSNTCSYYVHALHECAPDLYLETRLELFTCFHNGPFYNKSLVRMCTCILSLTLISVFCYNFTISMSLHILYLTAFDVKENISFP